MRPLIYYNIQNLGIGNLKGLMEDEPIPDRWERYWRTYAVFRWTFIILTAIWRFGLLFEIPFHVLIIYKTRTTNDAVYIGAIFGYSWFGCLILSSTIFSKWMQILFVN
ncbi:21090_t:CDS:1 [Dentiscutata erythropus]|uniref:21090_t:CDS:1 n=1 Tax=Dentiscutata erythropus TaxID=1348616 RepID=A0A9N9JT89_9GLOM|nr:21090_t:CDS:1 [Dentiscutata erythropus]